MAPPSLADGATAQPSTASDSASQGQAATSRVKVATIGYSCEGGHSVVVGGDGDMARVTFSDGRTVQLPRDLKRHTPAYSAGTLQFSIPSGGGLLGEDAVGSFDCEPTV